jgi:signal peptide peptidase SppA
MKDYIHLHELIFNKPHLCTPEYAETVLAVVGGKFGIEEGAFSVQSEAKDQKEQNVNNGVLTIPILGSMVHRGSSLDAMSGINSYQSIQASIQEGLDNPAVKQILLDMDSPGGSVAGAFDLKDFILEAKEQKPIYAIANDTMASAAFLIGSAATKVFATQTAQVGSIGVVAMHMDRSEANKKEGLKPTFIYAGDMKVAGNPHEALKGEALEYIQESVMESYEMFVNAVSENRGIDVQAIRDTEARTFKGSKAKELGLVDDVISMDALTKQLATDSPKRVFQTMSSSKGKLMDKEEIEKLEADFAQVSAQMDALKGENESLRKALIDNGFKITAEGVEKTETQEEATVEMIEINGEQIDKASIPAPVLAALEAANAEKAEAALEKQAAEMLPHFNMDAAKAILKAGLSDDVLAQLKAADRLFENQMEETGEAGVDGDMSDPKEALNKLIEDYAEEHNVSIAKATSEVTAKGKGRDLYKQVMKKD